MYLSGRYVNQLRGEIDVEKILYRLDRLTPEEAQRTVTPTLEVIYGLVHNLTLVMEGARPLLVPLYTDIEHVSG